jgi:hypothetical protein
MDLYQSAHLDYYLARPLEMKLISFGRLEDVHKYAWINQERGLLRKGKDALFITHSRDFKTEEWMHPYFEKVELIEKIPIYRNGHLAQNFFIYRLNAYLDNYPFPQIGKDYKN